MKAFLDTSVLVSTFYVEHERHESTFALFLRLNKKSGWTAAPCLPEVYSALTGMPGKDWAGPDEALLFLADVRPRLCHEGQSRVHLYMEPEAFCPSGCGYRRTDKDA